MNQVTIEIPEHIYIAIQHLKGDRQFWGYSDEELVQHLLNSGMSAKQQPGQL